MSGDTEWEKGKLLAKAIVYAKYAKDADRSSPLYGFWSALYLEILARASLAHIHPVLLADPQDGKNILYVFGVNPGKGEPVSVPAKTVYTRCQALIPAFDDKALQHCSFMAKARNTEVHSGESGFEPMTHNRWQPEHYRVTKILCDSMAENLSHFFEPQEATSIEEALAASSKEVEGIARGKVKTFKSWFESQPEASQNELRHNSIEVAKKKISGVSFMSEIDCCACKSRGLIGGDREISRKVKLADDELTQVVTVDTSRFVCGACSIDLNREELISVGLPTTFVDERWVDPVEHFEVDPRDYFDLSELDISELEEAARRHGVYLYDGMDYGND